LVDRENVPKQLCQPNEFRDKMCGKATGYSNLIKTHNDSYGIPQGAPLSDLLANAYLVDFDIEMKKHASRMGGYYMRYSDDILFIIPGNADKAENLMKHVRARIPAFGKKLQIKESKCFIDSFQRTPDGIVHQHIYPAEKGSNGLTYLGFRFDGKRVYLRDQTLSNFRRKIARAIKSEAYGLVKRFPGKDLTFLNNEIDSDEIIKRFGRVKDCESKSNKREWTFWTYVKRSEKVFGKKSKAFQQISSYRVDIRKRTMKVLAEAYWKNV